MQTHKMEAVNQLTGGVAHDFNNLLTSVMGNLDLLRNRFQDDALAQKYLATAYRASQTGATLTDRLLAFSRRQELAAEVVDINVVAANFSQLASRTLGKNFSIEAQLANDLWPVIADPGQLEDSLLNLALNARAALPEGGEVRIITANLELDAADAARHDAASPGDYVMIGVVDEGEGMAPDTVARAFEPFFTTRGVGEGSGLGLAMVLGFTQQSGGYITIESTLGAGTAVRSYLPRAKTDVGPEPVGDVGVGAPPSAIPRGGETIMVVEDQDDLRSFMVNFLNRLGYHVLEAGVGRVEMLLTDVVLPAGMGGVDLARDYQKRFPNGKVLYTSGYPDHFFQNSGRLRGNGELLQKPFRAMQLAQTVRRVLDAQADT